MAAPMRLHYGGTGFLYGLGTGSISNLEALSGDVGEIVRDFTEYRAPRATTRTGTSPNEQAYTELGGFIRVAAQVVFEELLPLRSRSTRRSSGCIEPDSAQAGSWHGIARSSHAGGAQFMRMLGKEAIAILPAAPVRHRNGDIEYAYRQDSHFII